MSKQLLTFVAVAATATAANAATISISAASNTDWDSPTTNASFVNNAEVRNNGVLVGDRAGNGTTNTASYDVSDFIADGDASGSTLQYTIGGLDIDGSGGFNDNIVVNFIATGHDTLTTLMDAGPPATPRNAGWLSSGGSKLDANNDFFRLDFSSMTVNLNGGSDNGIGTWGGFTGVELGSFNADGHNATINGSVADYTANGSSPLFDLTAGGNDSSLNVQFLDANGNAGNNGYRVDNFSFEVTAAVPEPSSTALLGLGGLALILRRRK